MIPKNKNKTKIEDMPDILTLQETANYLRVAPLTIKRWVKRGRLRGIRINERGDLRFLKAYIMRRNQRRE